MTLREITDRLYAAGVPDADFDGLILASRFTGKSVARLMADRDADLISPDLERAVARRERREPLQYIVGEWEFMGLPFEVSPACLIPRQDTETLVEEALKLVHPGMKIMDMCTGSGCVLISILKNAHGVEGFGYDISKQAINVAKENAKLNDVAADFERSDLFDDVMEEQFDMLVSNPPYIRSEEIATLMPEVTDFEPHEALDGKEDGLYFYRKLIAGCPEFVKPGGYVLFEIGYDQGEDVSSMMKDAGFLEVAVVKDLAHHDRVVLGKLPGE